MRERGGKGEGVGGKAMRGSSVAGVLKTLKADDEKRLSHSPTGFPGLPPLHFTSPCQMSASTPPSPPRPLPRPPPAVFSQSDASALQCNLWPESCLVRANQLDVALKSRSKKWPSLACFSAKQSPLSLSHREDPRPHPPALWHWVCLLQTNYQRMPAGLPGVLAVYHRPEGC